MKIECQIEKIKNALIVADRITGKNLTLPVLSSVLWVATNKKLILRSTNLSLGIEIEVPAKIEKEGVVAIRSDILNTLFSQLNSDGSVIFELINNNLSIKTKNNTILIKSIPYEDFPTIPIISGESFLLPSKKITEGIRSVYYSASTSEIKPEIGSIYIYPEEDMLIFVATDSFRLAEKKIKIKQKLSFPGILIPYKNTIEIMKILDGVDYDIKITLQKNQISISLPNIYLTSRIIDGSFPDYKQIIPRQPATGATILKQEFLSSLKISNIFSDKFNQITITVKPSNKIFEIESKNSDIGENKTALSAVLSGDEVSANFNYKYVIDCFQSVSVDSLNLELNGSNRAMVIRPVGDVSFMYLVMPMNR